MGSLPTPLSLPGDGHIAVGSLTEGISSLESIAYRYPLKLVHPSLKTGQKSVLIFLLSYGGGLVGNDQVNLVIDIKPQSRLSLVTQGYTKIFKPRSSGANQVTKQKLQANIADDAALCLLPDPLQPFEGSNYQQVQIFKLARGASLCMLDWVTHGRGARGENWDLLHWTGRNEIWSWSSSPEDSRERLLVRDSVILDGSPEAARLRNMPLCDTMHGHNVFGTLILRGPLMKALSAFFLAEFEALPRLGARDFRTPKEKEEAAAGLSGHDKWRAGRIQQEIRGKVIWSAARVRGCVVVKFGAATVEAGRTWISSILRRDDTIHRHFGHEALMCV